MFQTELLLSTEDNLLKKFEEIHNFIYANDGLSEQQVLDELIKILFIKFTDETAGIKKFHISNEEINDINNTNKSKIFKERIINLFNTTKKKYNDLFAENEILNLSGQSLAFIVRKLQNIDFHRSTKDAKGLAFQKFLSSQAKSGRGQFFTPEPIIDFCVEILSPNPTDKIIDPACGTGGFLFSTLKYIEKNYNNINLKDYVEQNIFAIEINTRISQIAKMKFLLECNANANILNENALFDLDELTLKFSTISKINQLKETFDIVLTNPPFGSQGKISNKQILSNYDLGYKWSKYENTYYKSKNILKGQIPDILFIERSLQLLKPGGKLGIVLPNGLFENSSLEYLRLYIKTQADIIGVIRLPQETFIPYGTGVKASLLFLKKHSPNTKNKQDVFFSKITKLGYQGNKNGTPIYKKDKSGNYILNNERKKIVDEDFSIVLNEFNTFKETGNIKKSQNSFIIPHSEINGRFDFDYYSPENRKLIQILKKSNSFELGDIVEIVKTKSKIIKQDTIVEYVELSDVNTHSFEIINSTTLHTSALPSRASYKLKENDIITAVAGNSIGTQKHATALVTKEYENAICTNGFRILRNPKIDIYYLLYYLKSEAFLKQVFMYRTGAAIPAISDNDLYRILVYIPNNNELEQISSKVKISFNLRKNAQNILRDIHLEITNNAPQQWL